MNRVNNFGWNWVATYWPLCLFVLLSPLFWWKNNQGIVLSDEYFYARSAYRIAFEGHIPADHDIYESRWGMTVPIAGFLRVLGTHYAVYFGWSFVCFLCLLVFGWKDGFRSGKNTGIWMVAILGTNPAIWASAVNLSHDLVAVVWMALSLVMIWQIYTDKPIPWWWAPVAALLFFMGFMAKETALYFIPFWLFRMYHDRKDQARLRFWIGFSGMGLIYLCIYFILCKWLSGSFLYRIETIQSLYLSNLGDPFSLVGKSWMSKIFRVFIRPIPFLLKEPGYGMTLVALLVVWMLKKPDPNPSFTPSVYWGQAALWSGFYLIFGTVSFTEYVPITLVDRIGLVALVPAIWYLVHEVQSGSLDWHLSHKWLIMVLMGVIAVGLGIIYIYKTVYINTLFPVVYAALVCVFLTKRPTSLRGILLPLLFAGQVIFMGVKPATSAFQEEQKLLNSLAPARGKTLILTDKGLARLYAAHFEFKPPSHLHFAHWDTLQRMDTAAFQQVYLLKNHVRIQSPFGASGTLPPFVAKPHGQLIFKSKEVEWWTWQ